MSTQNTQTSSSQFDPNSMGVFQGLTKTYGSAIQDEIQNPYSNMFFNMQQARGNQAINAQNASGQQSMIQRAQAMGMDPHSPAFMQMLNQSSRFNQGRQSDMMQNLLLQAQQLRQGAIGQAGAYRPLQTGQTQTQKQSGLGTWLPQLAGAALGMGGKILSGKMAGGGDSGGGSSFFGGGAGTQGGYTPQDFQGSGMFASGQGQFGGLQPTSFDPGNPFLRG